MSASTVKRPRQLSAFKTPIGSAVRQLGGDDLGELEQPREQQTAGGTDRETDQQPANVAPRAAEESDRVNSR